MTKVLAVGEILDAAVTLTSNVGLTPMAAPMTADAQKKLVAGCKKYLSDHPGTVWFAAGTLVTEHSREVNDRGFHVALHLVFKDKAAHDKYQQADGHHKFIEEFKDNWKSVRVFDSWLQATSHAETPED